MKNIVLLVWVSAVSAFLCYRFLDLIYGELVQISYIALVFFFLLLIVGQFLIMEIISYGYGAHLEVVSTYFDRYWINAYDRISYYGEGKRVAMWIIALLLSFISFGLIVFLPLYQYVFHKNRVHYPYTITKVEAWLCDGGKTREISNFRKAQIIYWAFVYVFSVFIMMTIFGMTKEYYVSYLIFLVVQFVPLFRTHGEILYKGWKQLYILAAIQALSVLILGWLRVSFILIVVFLLCEGMIYALHWHIKTYKK